jgi:rod shape-determining protein MreD
MSSLNKSSFLKLLFSYFPVIILFLSVFNEFDFNYLKIEYFSFNFVHILIFYWTLRNPDHISYISIFLAGLINDVVIGIPMGISSFGYLLICSVTAYIRNITLSPNFINDWLSFLFTILLINSVQILILDLILLIEVDYMRYLVNLGFTFILYPLFFFIFSNLDEKIIIQKND